MGLHCDSHVFLHRAWWKSALALREEVEGVDVVLVIRCLQCIAAAIVAMSHVSESGSRNGQNPAKALNGVAGASSLSI